MTTIRYWDNVEEKLVVKDLWPVQELHAAPNRVVRLDYIRWEFNHPMDWYYFTFFLYTEWDLTTPYKIIPFFDREVIDSKTVPMIAMKMNRTIVTYAKKALMDNNIASLQDAKYLRETMHKHITEFDVHLAKVKDPVEPEPDLRPYVFLRFLLTLPVIPEENLHSIYVQQEAMAAEKRILKDAAYIKSLSDEHYKKYWTLAEKTKVYLSNFFK